MSVLLTLGRVFCVACRRVWTVQYAPGAIVRCLRCGHVVEMDASGDEV